MILSFHLKGDIVEKKKGTYGVVYIVKQNTIPQYVAYKTTKEEHDAEKIKCFYQGSKSMV